MIDSSSPSVQLLGGGILAGGAVVAKTVEFLFPVTVIAVEAEFD
jgi:hypothetical protein